LQSCEDCACRDTGPSPANAYFFFLGRCARSLAAARFSALLDFGSRSTFEAAFPARLLVGTIITTSLVKIGLLLCSVLPLWRGGGNRHHSIAYLEANGHIVLRSIHACAHAVCSGLREAN